MSGLNLSQLALQNDRLITHMIKKLSYTLIGMDNISQISFGLMSRIKLFLS